MCCIHAHVTFSFRVKSAKQTDRRVHVMNEVISGVRVIKMYAWEYAFKKLVKKLRRQVAREANHMNESAIWEKKNCMATRKSHKLKPSA